MANLNLNKVILGGRLTADVEMKQTASGVSVCSFSIAVNRKGSKEQQTDFINCTAWRQTAEFIGKYFRKGSSICVVGNLQVRNWKDQNGNKRYSTEVVVDEALFVDSKNDATGATDDTDGQTYIPEAYTAASPNFASVADDDSLPF